MPSCTSSSWRAAAWSCASPLERGGARWPRGSQTQGHEPPASTSSGKQVAEEAASEAEAVDGRSGTTLRLVCANAASGLDRSSWTVSIERFAKAVADLEADVVALQEVDHLLPRTGVVDQPAVIAASCARNGQPWQHRFAAAVHGTPGDPRTVRPADATRPDEASYG